MNNKTFNGYIKTGAGGAGKVTIPKLSEQLTELMGAPPYPGTLNVMCDEPMEMLTNPIEYYNEQWNIFPCTIVKDQDHFDIRNFQTAYIIRHKKHMKKINKLYDFCAEIIATTKLREIMDLADGDKVIVVVSSKHIKER